MTATQIQMHPHQEMVRQFHQIFGLTVNDAPTDAREWAKLRHDLHIEEFSELREAKNRVETADALGDLRYVLLGTAVTFGVIPEPARLSGLSNIQATFNHLHDALILVRSDCARGEHSMLPHSIGLSLAHIDRLAEWFAIPLDACFQEIHRSNLSKLWHEDEFRAAVGRGGTHNDHTFLPVGDKYVCKRADGKAVKPSSYSPADLASILNGRVAA